MIAMTDQQEFDIIEAALKRARPVMQDRACSYDTADAIATAISTGIKQGLIDLGLRPDPDVTLVRRVRLENGRLAEPVTGVGEVGTLVLLPEPHTVMVVDSKDRAFFVREDEAEGLS